MTEIDQIYRCSVCGNIIEILHSGEGQLVCCSKSMELLNAKNKDVGLEKHVPIIEKTESGVIVKIGSISHPMEESHYIEFIEIIADGKIYRKFLKPGEEPMVNFNIKINKIEARGYCNIHGLWKSS
jgi:superoxide reductase